MRIAALGNKLLQFNTLDNKTFEAEPDKIAAVIGLAVNLLHLLSAVFRPFMPLTTASIAAQIGSTSTSILIPDSWSGADVPVSQPVGEAKHLFTPIAKEKEDEWRDQFGGEEMRKQKAEAAAKAEKKRLDKERKRAKKEAAKAALPAAADPEVQELAGKLENLRS